GRAIRDLILLSQNESGEQWDHYLVMARERKSAPAARNRSPHDVSQRAIVLDEIEVRRRKIFEPESEIANNCHCLQKDFRQHHGRAEIQVSSSAVKLAHNRAEKSKVSVRSLPGACAVGGRMNVHDVRSYGDVNGDRHIRFVGGIEQ